MIASESPGKQISSELVCGWILDLIDTFECDSATDRPIAPHLRERLHGEIYRRERERYAEWVDFGGES